MRQYLQGTLDYACGIYAVINALACTHGLDLSAARDVLREAFWALPEQPRLWRAFTRNETDHYWLIRRTLSRWCCGLPWEYRAEQPFGEALLPAPDGTGLEDVSLHLPEHEVPRGPSDFCKAGDEAAAVWAALRIWFAGQQSGNGLYSRVALLRFHRFIPGLEDPIVSHWTTVCRLQEETLHLHDASSEKQAIRAISKSDCCPADFSPAIIRIVPESLLFLERPVYAGARGIPVKEKTPVIGG